MRLRRTTVWVLSFFVVPLPKLPLSDSSQDHEVAHNDEDEEEDGAVEVEGWELVLSPGCEPFSPAVFDAMEDYTQNYFFRTAIEEGDTTVVAQLVAHGVDIHKKWDLYHTQAMPQLSFLSLAAYHGRNESLSVMFKVARRDDMVPFNYAVSRGHVSTVRLLIAAGYNVNQPDPDGCHPVTMAVRLKKAECLHALVEIGADPSLPQVPLVTEACAHCSMDCLQYLLAAGFELDPNSTYHGMPLLYYITCEYTRIDTRITTLLIEAGADINAQSHYGRTPIAGACCINNMDVLPLLIAAGADLNKPDHCGLPPIFYAFRSFESTNLLSLLEAGVFHHTKCGYLENGTITSLEEALLPHLRKNLRRTWQASKLGTFIERKGMAFLMGKHGRLGANSPIRMLPDDLIQWIHGDVTEHVPALLWETEEEKMWAEKMRVERAAKRIDFDLFD